MKYILAHLRPYYRKMSLGLAIKIAGTVMDLILPYILACLIDTVVPSGRMDHILLLGGCMIICALLGMVGNVVANRMASAVARDSTGSLRLALFAKISSLSAAQVDRLTVPTLESRVTSDTYHVHQMVGMMQRLGVRAPILLIGGIVVTACFEPVLTLVIVALLPFMALAIWRISRTGVPLYQSVQAATDDMIRVVRENCQGIRVVKALSRVSYETDRFSAVKDDLTDKETRAGTVTATSGPLMSFFLYLGQTTVILIGAYRVSVGVTEAGKIIAFLSYFTLILNAMLAISRMFVMLSKGIASANRIAEIIELESDLALLPPEEGITAHAPLVEFDSVSFAYSGEKEILTDLSFQIPASGSLGIIGATGSGKSTILRLLMRFYDPCKGRILIRGRDIRTIPPGELYATFGATQQNDSIFAVSLRDNVDLWRNLSEDALHKATEISQSAGFISEKEQGFDTMAGVKGANLSGGQRQRLTIARALAARPAILLFDDSSSALDYKTDAEMRAAIRASLSPASCRIVVAQRVSALIDCDEILVIEKGRIIGRGSHEELLASCDLYREISLSQMGGEILE